LFDQELFEIISQKFGTFGQDFVIQIYNSVLKFKDKIGKSSDLKYFVESSEEASHSVLVSFFKTPNTHATCGCKYNKNFCIHKLCVCYFFKLDYNSISWEFGNLF
jgi:hypothetical protein